MTVFRNTTFLAAGPQVNAGVMRFIDATTMTPVAGTTTPLPFWARQFAPEPSGGQIAFDVLAGILLPIACVTLDPIVFRASFGEPLLGHYALMGYLGIAGGILTLGVWLFFRCPASVLAGALCASAVFSFVVGVLLLPFTLIGLFAIIGVLGLSPFLTSFVCWRNTVRAFAHAKSKQADGQLKALALASFAVVLLGPAALQFYIQRQVAVATELALSSNDEEADRGANQLRRYAMVVDADTLVWAYDREKDPNRRERLARVYKDLKGQDIEERLARLED